MKDDEPACAPIEGIDPGLLRPTLLHAMAARYCASVPGLSVSEGMDAAVATWGTEWPDDPAPRTMEGAIEAVDGDLECWDED